MDSGRINAEVISVFPNKVKILVEDLEDFRIAEENLKVGSYLRISDNENAILIAIIENFSIEIGKDTDGSPARKYILEANPLGIIRDGKFERGGDSLAIPPKQVEPAKLEEIEKISSLHKMAKADMVAYLLNTPFILSLLHRLH
jgi:hypothetical protein